MIISSDGARIEQLDQDQQQQQPPQTKTKTSKGHLETYFIEQIFHPLYIILVERKESVIVTDTTPVSRADM